MNLIDTFVTNNHNKKNNQKMKKLVLSLATVALFLGSCSSDNEEIIDVPTPTGTITGDITTTKSYPKGNYTIQGTVKVKNGGSLTI